MATETIHLPPDLDEVIQSAAVRTGRAKHELMVELLERGVVSLARAEIPESTNGSSREWRLEDLESFGIGEDAELSGADVKDWLKATWRPS